MTTQTVQPCGCIALPEELQIRTGLYPGAAFQLQVAEDGSSVTLSATRKSESTLLAPGTVCSKKEDPPSC